MGFMMCILSLIYMMGSLWILLLGVGLFINRRHSYTLYLYIHTSVPALCLHPPHINPHSKHPPTLLHLTPLIFPTPDNLIPTI